MLPSPAFIGLASTSAIMASSFASVASPAPLLNRNIAISPTANGVVNAVISISPASVDEIMVLCSPCGAAALPPLSQTQYAS